MRLCFLDLELTVFDPISSDRNSAPSRPERIIRFGPLGSRSSTLIFVTRSLETGVPYCAVEMFHDESTGPPCFLPCAEFESLLVGLENTIYGIGIRNGELQFQIEVASPISALLKVASQPLTFVLHELGMVAITSRGDRRWTWNANDLITESRIEGPNIAVKLDDGQTALIDLATGIAISTGQVATTNS